MSAAQESWVLIVDDDALVTETLAMLLEIETDWNVVTHGRATGAIESLSEHVYDLVLSDFLMPGMDGIDLLKHVRDAQPAASRVLLTGYADKQNAIRAINEAGLFHYVEKPWDNASLLLVLRNAVERARLLRELDGIMHSLSERDRSLSELRARLIKAIL